MIVAIDGPAGAGKSSVARRLADRLGFAFLDTGAMYRCVTLFCLRNSVDLHDANAVSNVAKNIHIRMTDDRVWIDNEDVTDAIRDGAVNAAIKHIADNVEVRKSMVESQRRWASSRDVVTEGRDQGTVAFPNAECKIFLTASPEERARRRVAQLQQRGVEADLNEILTQQCKRDFDDENRPVGALKPAVDAIRVLTDGLNEDEVLEKLAGIVLEIKAKRHDSKLDDLGCES
jgi:cytidylate kinase